jgi:hypothetical protein
MLRLFGIASDHGRNNSDKQNKENNMLAANWQPSPDGVVASSPNHEQTPDGLTEVVHHCHLDVLILQIKNSKNNKKSQQPAETTTML